MADSHPRSLSPPAARAHLAGASRAQRELALVPLHHKRQFCFRLRIDLENELFEQLFLEVLNGNPELDRDARDRRCFRRLAFGSGCGSAFWSGGGSSGSFSGGGSAATRSVPDDSVRTASPTASITGYFRDINDLRSERLPFRNVEIVLSSPVSENHFCESR